MAPTPLSLSPVATPQGGVLAALAGLDGSTTLQERRAGNTAGCWFAGTEVDSYMR